MTIALTLDSHRKARIWLDEMPDALFLPDTVVEQVVPAAVSPVTPSRKTAVELLIPKGPIGMYGLLGAEFLADTSGSLRVRVGISRQTGRAFNGSLALRSDTVSVGLAEEYAQTVLDGTTGALPASPPSGVLLFNCAAQGAVGSNRAIFKRLSALVVTLLAIEPSQATADSLAPLFRFS